MRYTFIFLIALSSLIRLFFSVDLTDESNYVAHAWTFLQDSQLFKSDLFIHGAAGLVLAPFTFIYTKVFGGEAFVLFLRLSFFCLMLLTAFNAYEFFKRHYRPDWSMLAASFYLAFMPFSIGSWSYNNVAAFGVPLSLFLLWTGGRWRILLAGIMASIVCFCYPPMALVYVFTLILYWQKLFFMVLVLGGVISAFFLGQTETENIQKVMLFADIFSWSGGLDKIKDIFFVFYDGFMQSGLLVLLIVGLALRLLKKQSLKSRYNFIFLCAFLFWTAFVRLAVPYSISWLIYAPFIALIFFLWDGTEESVPLPPHRRMLALGFFTAIVFGYTSSNILVNCALGMVLPLQLILLGVLTTWEKQKRITSIYGSLLFGVITLFLSFSNYNFVYRDQAIAKLDHMIPKGPFRFLNTTKERALMLEEFRQDLIAASVERQTIFSSYFAAAYFFTELKPVTGMLFIHEMPWPKAAVNLILHRTIEKNEWPDVIVTKKSTQPNFDYQFENFFLASGRYQMQIERVEYRIFLKNQNSKMGKYQTSPGDER